MSLTSLELGHSLTSPAEHHWEGAARLPATLSCLQRLQGTICLTLFILCFSPIFSEVLFYYYLLLICPTFVYTPTCLYWDAALKKRLELDNWTGLCWHRSPGLKATWKSILHQLYRSSVTTCYTICHNISVGLPNMILYDFHSFH